MGRTCKSETQSFYNGSGPATPWGRADHALNLAPGVRFFGTPGHGGVYVSKAVAEKKLSAAAINRALFWGGAYWYEEDCDMTIPLYEVRAWRETFIRLANCKITVDDAYWKHTIEKYHPEYFTDNSTNVKVTLPKVGDVLRFTQAVNWKTASFGIDSLVRVIQLHKTKLVFEAVRSIATANVPYGLFALSLDYAHKGIVKVVDSALVSNS